ncbi:MAG: universal stress protein [Bacteroidia bacterium]
MSTFSVKKILVPIDFSANSIKALDYAARLAKLTQAEIMLAHVVETMPVTSDPFRFSNPEIQSYDSIIMDSSTKHLKQVADEYANKNGIAINAVSLTGRTHREIVSFSEKIKSDLIVMGTHGVSGFREFIAGSNTFRVVSDVMCPVLSVQEKSGSPDFKNILVPFRDKPHSREKVNYAIELAKIYGATLHIIGIDTEQSEEHLRRIQLEADQIIDIIGKSGLTGKLKVVSADYRSELVLDYAKEVNADLLVVMADMDRDSLKEYFIGPFVQQVVNHSTIPVFSIRPKFNTDTVDLRFY